MTDTPKTPAEILEGQIKDLQWDISSASKSASLSSQRDKVEDLETKAMGFSHRLIELRTRNYAFDKRLETRAADLAKRWQTMKPAIQTEINRQYSTLVVLLPQVEGSMTRLASLRGNISAAQTQLAMTKTQLENLKTRIDSAERTINGMFDKFEEEIGKFDTYLTRVEWSVQQLSEACFQLYPAEALFMAVEVVWTRDGKEEGADPDGVLYLTDQRLIFEQKEDVATKKVLFITTETKRIQQLQFEVPLALIEKALPSKRGLFKNEDWLEITCATGAPFVTTWLHLKGQDCEEWQGLIHDCKLGEKDKGRAIEVDQAAVEKVKAAPTQCPACNGAITKPVMRGQDTITCEYCGLVIRL